MDYAQEKTVPLCRANVNSRSRTGPQRVRIDLDHTLAQPDAIRGEFLGERRRGAAVLQAVLVAVPRASHQPVDDAAFAERSILVCADIGQRANPVTVAEHRNALAIRRGDDA